MIRSWIFPITGPGPGAFGVFPLDCMSSLATLVWLSLVVIEIWRDWPKSRNLFTLSSNLLISINIWPILSLRKLEVFWFVSLLWPVVGSWAIGCLVVSSNLLILSACSSYSLWSSAYFSRSICLSLRNTLISSFNRSILGMVYGGSLYLSVWFLLVVVYVDSWPVFRGSVDVSECEARSSFVDSSGISFVHLVHFNLGPVLFVALRHINLPFATQFF